MALERVQDVPFVDADDDDMPPLVDNPYPSMTFTFAANMTPITYSADPSGFETTLEFPPAAVAPEVSMAEPETRAAHPKKKDANHIPRPPNAFILFRSSFIKAQHIPEKIEGNHSALSKIIGKYWKSLPKQEREIWEGKAIVALAEHRKKYPDWRFRPGTNSLSKVKDGPRRRNNRKGRGEVEKEVKNRAKRCDKIADLLVAGKTGVDLEAAIEAYDTETGGGPKVDDEHGCGVLIMKVENPVLLDAGDTPGSAIVEATVSPTVFNAPEIGVVRGSARETSAVQNQTDADRDARFRTPLTAMFKRSSSAPAAGIRTTETFDYNFVCLHRRDSFSGPLPTRASDSSPALPQELSGERDARAGHDAGATANEATTRGERVDDSVLIQSPALSFASTPEYLPSCTPSQWTEGHGSDDAGCYSPTLPAFVPDMDSPAPSPPAFPVDFGPDGEQRSGDAGADGSPAYEGQLSMQPHGLYIGAGDWPNAHTYPAKHLAGGYGMGFAPVVVTPQSPTEYPYDHIMKDAFEAAYFAEYEGLNMGLGSIQTTDRWCNNADVPVAYSNGLPQHNWF